MFNEHQQAYIDYLATLTPEEKCDCGWAKRGLCDGQCAGDASKGGYVKPAGLDLGRGLYQKYRVEHLDDPTGKHANCPYFVLDLHHDQHARIALQMYIDSCRDDYPVLANDLQRLLDSELERQGVLANPLAQLLVEAKHERDEPIPDWMKQHMLEQIQAVALKSLEYDEYIRRQFGSDDNEQS